MPLKFGGYAGAYMDDGLYDNILLQLAMELSQTLPNIIGKQHALKYLWAYKYDSDYTGINTHADEAAVNVNLWITPNEANLDPIRVEDLSYLQQSRLPIGTLRDTIPTRSLSWNIS